MNVLLVCAGGMSTSLLMKKMESYAQGKYDDFHIEATGLSEYKDIWTNFDCILMGPQVGYRKAEVESTVSIPVDVIAPVDYGMSNCPNIFTQIEKLLGQPNL